MREESSPKVGPARALAVTWGVAALGQAAEVARTLPYPDVGLRVEQHAHETLAFIGVGLIVGIASALWARFGAASRAAAFAAVAAPSVGLALTSLADDYANLATDLAVTVPVDAAVLEVSMEIGTGLAAAGLIAAARLLDRRIGRAVALAALALVAFGHHFFLRHGYPGAHLMAVWTAANGAGAALSGAALPARLRGGLARHAERIAAGVLLAAGVIALYSGPPNRVLVEMLKVPSQPLAPTLGRLWRHGEGERAVPPPPLGAWWARRDGAAHVAPSEPRLVPPDAIVLLLSIDAVRADVLERGDALACCPTLRDLRDRSVRFTTARAPGSQTVTSVTSTFSGTYYSQQYWERIESRGPKSAPWPYADRHVRFPALLRDAGVSTCVVGAAHFFANDFGLVGGFEREIMVNQGKRYAGAATVGKAITDVIDQHGQGPLFLFTHFLDPHAPYAPGPGTEFERYLRDVAAVDAAIGSVLDAVSRRGLTQRTTVVVTADHGEAFGEHGSTRHASTLYDEVLRVPLLIHVPGVAPREVSAPVTTMDLGPTILDLYGLPTPAQFVGQSLVGFLRGETPELSRPIGAEGRLKQAMVFPDGTKIIRDQRTGAVELYDLLADPAESNNLYDERSARAASRLAWMHTFFETHRNTTPGYTPPFRR